MQLERVAALISEAMRSPKFLVDLMETLKHPDFSSSQLERYVHELHSKPLSPREKELLKPEALSGIAEYMFSGEENYIIDTSKSDRSRFIFMVNTLGISNQELAGVSLSVIDKLIAGKKHTRNATTNFIIALNVIKELHLTKGEVQELKPSISSILNKSDSYWLRIEHNNGFLEWALSTLHFTNEERKSIGFDLLKRAILIGAYENTPYDTPTLSERIIEAFRISEKELLTVLMQLAKRDQ